MKRTFSASCLIIVIAFSFYFTDKVSSIAYNKNKLVKEIKSMQVLYYEKPINAQIDKTNNTIIPGKYGKKVNTNESYLNMSDFKKFNEKYLVFDLIKPSISLNEHKDKIVVSGNQYTNSISLLVMDNNKITHYLQNLNIPISIITDKYTNYKEIINISSDETNFKLLNRFIEKNKRFCLKSLSNLSLCKKYNYYILDSNLILKNSNFGYIKSKIKNGSIIIIDKDSTINDINLLIEELKFKDMKIVLISKLISEK